MTTHILHSSVCYVCGSEAVRVRELRPISYGGLTIDVEDEFMRCLACNEEFYAPGQAADVDARASLVARLSDRILPYEVRAIRKRLGLTQRGLESEFGLGAKVVTRWERGTTEPATPTVLLLRALENGSLTIALLRAARSVVPIEQSLGSRLIFADSGTKVENQPDSAGTDNYVAGTLSDDLGLQPTAQHPPIARASEGLALAA